MLRQQKAERQNRRILSIELCKTDVKKYLKNGKAPCPGYGTGCFVFWGAWLFRVFFLRIALGEELVGHVGEELPLGWLELRQNVNKLQCELTGGLLCDGHTVFCDLFFSAER